MKASRNLGFQSNRTENQFKRRKGSIDIRRQTVKSKVYSRPQQSILKGMSTRKKTRPHNQAKLTKPNKKAQVMI